MANRRRMQTGDWFDAVSFLAMGFCLGLAFDLTRQLDGAAFWFAAVGIPIMFLGLIAVAGLIERLLDRILPNGVKPARALQPKERKPLAVLFCVPAGVVSGLIVARLGLSGLLL